jgi:hypothetical protein
VMAAMGEVPRGSNELRSFLGLLMQADTLRRSDAPRHNAHNLVVPHGDARTASRHHSDGQVRRFTQAERHCKRNPISTIERAHE